MSAPTRQQRRTWRRRLSRARHTKHTHRNVIPFPPPPRGDGPAIGVWGRDLEEMYPDRIIRSPMAPRWP